jgi:hypothetical protein
MDDENWWSVIKNNGKKGYVHKSRIKLKGKAQDETAKIKNAVENQISKEEYGEAISEKDVWVNELNRTTGIGVNLDAEKDGTFNRIWFHGVKGGLSGGDAYIYWSAEVGLVYQGRVYNRDDKYGRCFLKFKKKLAKDIYQFVFGDCDFFIKHIEYDNLTTTDSQNPDLVLTYRGDGYYLKVLQNSQVVYDGTSGNLDILPFKNKDMPEKYGWRNPYDGKNVWENNNDDTQN